MNPIKLKVLTILSILVFIFAIPAQAEIVTIWGKGKHIMGDHDTKDDARKLALLSAKRMCLEKVGTYLESETIVKDIKLAKDEIKAYTAGIVKIKVVDEQISLIGESMCVMVKVKADIDTPRLDERIKQLRKDEKILDDYKRIQVENERLTKQIDKLQKQLAQAKGKEKIDKIKVARKDIFDELTALVWLSKAQHELSSGTPNWDLVIKWTKKAIELKPNEALAHFSVGVAYGKKGLHDRAIMSLKKAIEIKPDYALAYNNLGNAYGEKGLYDKAIMSLKKAIEIKPDYALAHYNLGVAYGYKGLYDKAIVSYKTTVELKPDYAEAHYGLGVVYNLKGLYDKAIVSFKRVIEIEPDDLMAHHYLGTAYLAKGEYDKAITSYKKVIKLDPHNPADHYNLGIAYGKKGLHDKEIASYKKAIELKPDFALAHYNLGLAYVDKGLKYVAADPLYKAGLLSLEQGDREGALKAYDCMRQFIPNTELTFKLRRKLYPE